VGTTREEERMAAMRTAWCVAGMAWVGVSTGAAAHPHVWIDGVSTFVFEEREIVAIRHTWRFDDFFSALLIGDHDVDGDGAFDEAELADLKESAFANLEEYDYFTHVRVDGRRIPTREVDAFEAWIEDDTLVYQFDVVLPDPIDPTTTDFRAGVYDEEFYVEILLDENDPVRFAGIASGACVFDIREDVDNPIYFGLVYPLAITVNCTTS
jgi:ABC-type uncharacterized transport system substrate-binding protein